MMDDLHKLTGTDCTELERLAAAAVTIGYSDNIVEESRDSSIDHLTTASSGQCDTSTHYITNVPTNQLFNGRTTYIQQQPHHEQENSSLNQPTIITVTDPQRTQIMELKSQQPILYEHLVNYPLTTIQYVNNQNEVLRQPHDSLSQQESASAESTHLVNFIDETAETNVPITSNFRFKSKASVKEVEATTSKSKEDNCILEHKRRSQSSQKVLSNVYVYPCDEKFDRVVDFEREKVGTKRNGLTLEVKIEIIKRINSGEKQNDIADEYNVNRSTIKSIMIKSNNFLKIWKKGSFHPDAKKLKGAKREDIEKALYLWYQQAIANGMAVTGSILCVKALEFAQRLGHDDFKATHGWLDRFKKRKNIVFGKQSNKKKKEDDQPVIIKPNEWLQTIASQILLEFQPNDVFAVEEFGIFYKCSPVSIPKDIGNRCAAGVKAKKRLTIVMCANLTGTEKFPLLVVGHHAKPQSFQQVKTLPVLYTHNAQSWITEEAFIAWLNDLDSWCTQQGRKICLLVPNLPIHSKSFNLKFIRVYVTPQGFIGPFRQGPITFLKCYYRRAVLDVLFTIISKEKSKKGSLYTKVPNITLLTALDLLANSWNSITNSIISLGFQRAGLIKYASWSMNNISEANHSIGASETMERLKNLGMKIPEVTFKDFVHFDDKVQVCALMDDDDIIASVINSEKKEEESSDEEDEKNSITHDAGKQKSQSFTISEVEKSIVMLRQHIQHQESSQEMLYHLGHLEFLINKSHSLKLVGSSSYIEHL